MRVARGASALLVERLLRGGRCRRSWSADSERALGRLSLRHAARPQAARVFAITGSNGKTSVKSLLLAILEQVAREQRAVVVRQPGQPQQRDRPAAGGDRCAGRCRLRHLRDGRRQAGRHRLPHRHRAPARIALVNNIAPAHLERMGSLQGVAGTKGAIYAALPADGVAVINADDAFGLWFEQHIVGAAAAQPRAALWPGTPAPTSPRSDIQRDAPRAAASLLVSPLGERAMSRWRCRAATTSATPWPPRRWRWRAGIGLALGCRRPGRAPNRCPAARSTHRLPNGAVLIDDSYNANPGSLAAAIDALAASKDEAWLVLGDMRELGPDAEALHAQAGRRARDAGFEAVCTRWARCSAAASQAFGDGGRHFNDARRAGAPRWTTNCMPACAAWSRARAAAPWTRLSKALLAQGEETPMLLELARWLQQLESLFGLFGYLTLRGILAALTALFLSLWLRPGDDPQAGPVQGRPADPQRRPEVPSSPRPARRPWAVR